MKNKAIVKVLQSLEKYPTLLEVFNETAKFLQANKKVQAIVVKGSLMKNTVDRYSDIDLVVFVEKEKDKILLKSNITAYFEKSYQLVSYFPATHIGLNDLLIFFLFYKGKIIKVDIEVATLSMAKEKMDFMTFYDPKNLMQTALKMQPQSYNSPNFDDLYAKFTGWIWYTYTKILRGELFEAADSLNVMRNYALIPFLQQKTNIPHEGLRFIEKRINPGLLKKLYATYPTAINKTELFNTLKKLIAFFEVAAADYMQEAKNGSKKASLNVMKKLLK